MSKEIIVNKGKQTRIAIVENGELAELFIENQEHERTIGNIFVGRIRRVMPSIQAAFVDIGQKQDAFLHFSDLIDNVESWLKYAQTENPVIGTFKGEYTTKPAGKKRRRPHDQRRGGRGGEHHHVADKDSKDKRKSAHGRQHSSHETRSRDDDSDGPSFDPTKILNRDQPILVKISKEPIANKGSRITTDISLAGRFLVLVPMANYVAVSKKIMSFKERRRLRALARSLLPEGFGVIVRTVAEGRSAKALDTDLRLLIDKWKKIEAKLQGKAKAPMVIHEDVNMVSSIMRDLFTEDYDRILIDDQKLYRNIRGYVQAIAPDMVDAVKLEVNAESIFQKTGIKNSVEEAFEDRVNLPSGGYLFIEQTEAMHVIDVNSGRAGRGMSQEDSSLKVNLEAAKIICKQIRLRDLGGIIVVDFIDMRHESNKRKLYETIKREFRSDRAVTKVLPMSDFGLVQITRQRLRPSITKTFSLPEDGGVPEGRPGRPVVERGVESKRVTVTPPDLLGKIEEWLAGYRESGQSARVRLQVHPFTASFLSGKFPSRTFRWRLRYGVRVHIDAAPSVDPMTFRFFDGASGKEVSRLPEPKEKPVKAALPPKKEEASAPPKKEETRTEDAASSDRESSRGRNGRSRSGRGRGRSRDGEDGGRSQDGEDRGRSRDGEDRGRSSRPDGGSRREDARSGSNSDSTRRSQSASARPDGRRDSAERSERTERQERGERPERTERQERGERPERTERQERGERNERSEREDRNERSEGGERAERGERSGRSGRSRGRGRSADADQADGEDRQEPRRQARPETDKSSEGVKPETEKPVAKDKPAAAETSAAAQKSSATDRPAAAEKPAVAEKPAPSEAAPRAEKSPRSAKADDGGEGGGEKPAPAKTTEKPAASKEMPTSNRFIKIDLTSGGGS
jgi:ribonuclease G